MHSIFNLLLICSLICKCTAYHYTCFDALKVFCAAELRRTFFRCFLLCLWDRSFEIMGFFHGNCSNSPFKRDNLVNIVARHCTLSKVTPLMRIYIYIYKHLHNQDEFFTRICIGISQNILSHLFHYLNGTLRSFTKFPWVKFPFQ